MYKNNSLQRGTQRNIEKGCFLKRCFHFPVVSFQNLSCYFAGITMDQCRARVSSLEAIYFTAIVIIQLEGKRSAAL